MQLISLPRFAIHSILTSGHVHSADSRTVVRTSAILRYAFQNGTFFDSQRAERHKTFASDR